LIGPARYDAMITLQVTYAAFGVLLAARTAWIVWRSDQD
jgi:hypothetical protein